MNPTTEIFWILGPGGLLFLGLLGYFLLWLNGGRIGPLVINRREPKRSITDETTIWYMNGVKIILPSHRAKLYGIFNSEVHLAGLNLVKSMGLEVVAKHGITIDLTASNCPSVLVGYLAEMADAGVKIDILIAARYAAEAKVLEGRKNVTLRVLS